MAVVGPTMHAVAVDVDVPANVRVDVNGEFSAGISGGQLAIRSGSTISRTEAYKQIKALGEAIKAAGAEPAP